MHARGPVCVRAPAYVVECECGSMCVCDAQDNSKICADVALSYKSQVGPVNLKQCDTLHYDTTPVVCVCMHGCV
jgi:hypothetical protein